MFTTFLLIAIPVLFIFIGTVAALSFAKDPAASETATREAATTVSPTLTTRPAATLFKPLARPVGDEAMSLQELVTVVEAHIRSEREAAQSFTRNPSTQTLWLN